MGDQQPKGYDLMKLRSYEVNGCQSDSAIYDQRLYKMCIEYWFQNVDQVPLVNSTLVQSRSNNNMLNGPVLIHSVIPIKI